MSLQHLTLGERIVMAARLLAVEHLRQEADDAGINVKRLQGEMAIIRLNEAKAAFANMGQPAATRDSARPAAAGLRTGPAVSASVKNFRQARDRRPAAAQRSGDDDRRAA